MSLCRSVCQDFVNYPLHDRLYKGKVWLELWCLHKVNRRRDIKIAWQPEGNSTWTGVWMNWNSCNCNWWVATSLNSCSAVVELPPTETREFAVDISYRHATDRRHWDTFFGLPAINADLLRFVLDVLQKIKEAENSATTTTEHDSTTRIVCVVSDRYARKYLYLYLFVPGLMCENFRSLSGFIFFGAIWVILLLARCGCECIVCVCVCYMCVCVFGSLYILQIQQKRRQKPKQPKKTSCY